MGKDVADDVIAILLGDVNLCALNKTHVTLILKVKSPAQIFWV